MLARERILAYESEGFVVIREASNRLLVDEFLQKREPKNYELFHDKVSHGNFLDGRTEFHENRWILDVLFPEEILNFFENYEKKFVLQLVEARVGTSGIPWHIDSLEPRLENSPEYIGVHVALEEASVDAGRFEIIAGSHNWHVDPQIINQSRCAEFWEDCYSYYENLINKNIGYKKYSFDSRPGDAIIWNGRSLHRGERAKDGFLTRRSIFGHLVSVSNQEQDELMTKDGQEIEPYNSIYIVATNVDKGNHHA